MSRVLDEQNVAVGTDVGVVQVKLKTVEDYGVEDLIRDKAISFARGLQFILLGKQVSKATSLPERTIATIYADNDIEVGG